MKKLLFPLLASAALLPALPALAQEAPPLAAEEEDAGEVVVADRIDPHYIIVTATGVSQRRSDVGRAVTVLTEDDLEARQATLLSDALPTVPGVSLARNGGVGGFTGVRIRGAEAEQTLVLIDGVRANDPSSPSGGFDFANLLAGSIGRVEVLRGANSVVWGGQAIGGVIDIHTKSAEYGVQADGAAEYGYADTAEAHAALRAAGETLSGALTAGYYRTDGISAAASGTERDGYRQYGTSGRVKAQLSSEISLEARAYYADSRADYDSDFPAPAFVVSDSPHYSTAREFYGYAGLNAALSDGDFNNRLGVSLANIRRDNFDPRTGTAPEFFARGSSERYEYQGDLKIGDPLRAVFGAEHEDSRLFDGSVHPTTGITSGYAQLIAKPLDQVTLTGGVRHDDHRDFGGHTSFAASVAAHPASGTQLRASYSEGFKAPTLYQLYSFIGDPGLRPETAKSYEVGAEQRLDFADLVIGASWFRRNTDHQINFDLGTFTYGNIDSTRTRGFELELRASPLDGLSLTAGYTHLRAENRSPGANFGNDLARRPRDFGSLDASYGFNNGLKLGSTLLVSGHSFDDAGNFTRLDGYALVGIRAEMPVSDQVVVYGRVDNLFDEQYRTVANYGTLGRAAYAGVRLRFD